MTTSTIVEVTAPHLTGVWIHDNLDSGGTVRQFLTHADDRGETIDIESSEFLFAGRTQPVYQFGDFRRRTIAVTLEIPWSDTWEDDLDFLIELFESRRPFVYRDNRGRLVYGVLLKLDPKDARWGTQVNVQFNSVEFDESVDSFFSVVASTEVA